jgi:hypothetical protein
MSTIQEPVTTTERESYPFGEGPFAEYETEERVEQPSGEQGFLPWTENFSPFADGELPTGPTSEAEAVLAEAFAELRDEGFDESLGELVAETEDVVGARFSDESAPSAGPEKERLASAHLAPIQFDAEQYLDRLSEGLAGLDIESLDPAAFEEVLERFDPEGVAVSPAGEGFLGSLIDKAKRVAKVVINTAKKVGQVAGQLAGPLVTAALGRLKALIRPLLKRVLSFAIGRLPEPLRAPARLLATKITGEGEAEAEAEAENEDYASSPAQATDVESLAESFDAALAEATVTEATATGVTAVGLDASTEWETRAGDEPENEGSPESRELEALAEARGKLIDTIQEARDGEDLTPAIEQFIPALLGALRVGINLVGRPRVVGFLARYLAQFIGKWVGPQLSGPLSKAIVDTGLRLVTLESGEADNDREAVPAMLAGTIEDTVRRLAENEDYVLEDESLSRLATADAFERAVATNFPHAFVRPRLQRAPSIGGRFVARRPRSARPYRRYNRTPEVEITAAIAERIHTFGGVTLAATLRAADVALPFRARVHIFEATVGTSLRRIAAIERGRNGVGRVSSTQFHPLTPSVAGLLLREPGLGVKVPPAFLRSRQRVAAGARFYYLEPLTGGPLPAGAKAAERSVPSQGRILVDTGQGRIVVTLYFSETDAQRIAAGVRAGRAEAVLLPALTGVFDGATRAFGTATGRMRVVTAGESGGAGNPLARLAPVVVQALRRALRSWALPILADWTRARAAEFVQAAANPASGVTVTLTLAGVPGMNVVREALNGKLDPAALQSLGSGAAFRGTPSGSVSVTAGKGRP